MRLPNYGRKIELLKQKADAEKELKAMEEAEAYLATLPLNCQVTEMMHSLHCHADHTAGCGYYYESWEKIGDTRKRLLKQADVLIERVEEHLLKTLEVKVTNEIILKTIEICQERYW